MDVQLPNMLAASEIKVELPDDDFDANEQAAFEDNSNEPADISSARGDTHNQDLLGAMSGLVHHLEPSMDILSLASNFVGQQLSQMVANQNVSCKPYRFPCKLSGCTFRAQKKSVLTTHLAEIHQKVYPHKYNCPRCAFASDSRSYIKMHLSTVHDKEKKFVCSFCDSRFTQIGGLKKHMRVIHEAGKSFVSCEMCRFRCENQRDLENHVRAKHLGEKPFTCDICGSSFRRNPAMLHHRSAVHFKEKPYHCILCDFRCSKRFALKIHLQSVHAQLRPYKCHLCLNKCYSNMKGLTYHINGFHNNIFPQFKCFYCGFAAKQKDYLKKHILLLHKALFKKKRRNKCDPL